MDRNVDLDKRFVPGEPPSLEQRSSAGIEFHRIGAKYLKDQFSDCRMVESGEFRRSGGASWLNGKETVTTNQPSVCLSVTDENGLGLSGA